ncbi:MAG TPA: GMC family oxidoreductase [Vicinamibacterales bacterium]|nr:GMC family oxidoreductase [Vicinamibacterales bacterium]
MTTQSKSDLPDRADLVLIGTGFASTFFLIRYLRHAPATARVVVLERGFLRDHQWHRDNHLGLEVRSRQTFLNRTPAKPWTTRLAFGGCSNCWWACTPRFLPEDFEMNSRYGIAKNWPLGYDELEPYYCDAEDVMSASGAANALMPRSRPYPLPPHKLSEPDRLLERHWPGAFFPQPTARPSRDVPGGRPRCCANGVCHQCPIDSKFTILNSCRAYYDDPRVRMLVGARVLSVDVRGAVAEGVRYSIEDREHVVRGEVVGLGANALYVPDILLRSGLDDGVAGRGLVEQVSAVVQVDLDGLDNFQGSTSITGHGYPFYAGTHRRDRAAALIETWNLPQLRDIRGRWRQYLKLKFVYEDLPQDQNRVAVVPGEDRPEVIYEGPSEYVTRALAQLPADVERFLAPLPVERYEIQKPAFATEGHILGTTPMGNDPKSSVVDRNQVHHRVRNLVVLGGGVFPTISPANPTLTISALSLRAADRLVRS